MPKYWNAVPPSLRCPLCDDALASDNSALRCPHGHTYDVARDGYVNLLVSRQKLSPTVGDNKAMLRARQVFLGRGYYAPLADAVHAYAREYLTALDRGERSISILDAGCGTGYYLARLLPALSAAFPGERIWACGLDVSRDAAAVAARAHPEMYVVVADLTRTLPVADGSVDVALNIFSPRNAAEFARVIRPDGLLLTVIPTERHLASLRSALPMLDIEPNKRARISDQVAGAFHLVASDTLEYEMSLPGSDLAALVAMTPAYRRLTEQDLERVAQMSPRPAQASFEILRFRRSR